MTAFTVDAFGTCASIKRIQKKFVSAEHKTTLCEKTTFHKTRKK